MALKIFIGRWFERDPAYAYNHTKAANIVATSYKHATELSGLPYSELKNYFSKAPLGELGNDLIRATCTEIGVWIQDDPHGKNSYILRKIK